MLHGLCLAHRCRVPLRVAAEAGRCQRLPPGRDQRDGQPCQVYPCVPSLWLRWSRGAEAAPCRCLSHEKKRKYTPSRGGVPAARGSGNTQGKDSVFGTSRRAEGGALQVSQPRKACAVRCGRCFQQGSGAGPRRHVWQVFSIGEWSGTAPLHMVGVFHRRASAAAYLDDPDALEVVVRDRIGAEGRFAG